MGKMQRDKGKRFERYTAHLFQDYGYEAIRSAQHCGKSGDAADVIGVPYLHLECKACEQFRIYDWMDQAKRDSEGTGNLPTVIYKKNNHEVLVTMRLDDFMRLYREYEASMSFSEHMNKPE